MLLSHCLIHYLGGRGASQLAEARNPAARLGDEVEGEHSGTGSVRDQSDLPVERDIGNGGAVALRGVVTK